MYVYAVIFMRDSLNEKMINAINPHERNSFGFE